MSGPQIRQSDRGFGLMFAGFFAVLFTAVWLIFGARWDWVAGAAVVFLVAGLAAPWVLMPLNRLWGVLALRLGRVNNFVVLGLFYYLIMLPVALVMKLAGKDPMNRSIAPGTESYWQPVRRNPDRENFHDMF